MSVNKRLISTGAGAITCTTDSTDPFGDSSGVALYSLDYDASEASGYYDGTPTNVEFGVGGKINYGARFNGSSSGINLPSSLNTSVIDATGAFSISMWINANDISTIQYLFCASTANNIDLGINSNNLGAGKIVWTIYNTTYSQLVSTTTITTGVWYNIVATYDNGLRELFINGVSQGTATKTLVESSIEPTLGYRNTGGSVRFNGSIDQVRIFSKALSTDEVDTLFVEAPCVYTCTTDTVDYPTTNLAYYKLDNSAEDETGSYDGTESNIEYRFGRFGQAAVFNGSSSKIQLPTSTFSPSTFSLSAWCNVTSDTDENTIIELVDNQTYPNNTTIVFSAGSTGYSSRFLLRNYTTNQYNYNPSGTVSKNVWKHYAMTYDGSTVKSYIDGSLVDSGSLTLSNTVGTISSIQIGLSSGSRHLNGSIDQVRIYSTALTSSQVTELYEEKPCADTSNFKTVLYTGNGSTQYISNVGFEPDMVWAKARSNTHPHVVFDIVRGENKQISPDEATSEVTRISGAYEFETNGFTVSTAGNSNNNNYTYVAWCWKSGGEAVQNTQGDITSDVSANTAAGFSIVKYTGSSTIGDTIGHGIEVDGVATTPDLIIVKNLDTNGTSWATWSSAFSSASETLFLDLSSTSSQYTNRFGTVNATTFQAGISGGSEVNSSGNEMIAYVWKSIAGYSKIGSYTGNGSSTGTIVDLDFAPSFVMIKGTDQTSDWIMIDNKRDTTNPNSARLDANSSGTEYTGENIMDLNSDGFQLKTSSSSKNGLNKIFIYMAFK